MTKPQHTPGPWILGTHPANHRLNIIKPVFFSKNVTVLPDCEGGHISIKNIADAHLIAAAPDMFEALQAVRMHKCMFDSDEEFEAACQKVNAAIAKAEGKK